MRLLPRSLALRAALTHAVAAVLICLPGSWLAYRYIDRTLTDQLAQELAGEAEALQRWVKVPTIERPALMEEIRQLTRRGGPTHWLLQFEGVSLGGQLQARADPVEGRHLRRENPKERTERPTGTEGPGPRQWLEAAMRPEAGVELLAHCTQLGSGYYVVLAADLAPVHATALMLAATPLLVGLLTGLVALVVGLLSTRRLERRLRGVSVVAAEVMAGSYAQRLPARADGDEIDRLAQTVNGMLTRIETQVGDLRHVTRSIAHEMNTPLARMRLPLDAALTRPRDAERDQATFHQVLEELDEAAGLFRLLLGTAEPTASGDAPRERVDMSELVAEAGEFRAAHHDEAGGALLLAVAPGLAVLGQEALLKAAVSNLIENAQRHAGAGATIRLNLLPLEQGGVRLEVADDGPGIPAAERGRVLERFYRLARSKAIPGSGLGLALVAAVARSHGAVLSLADAMPGAARPGLRVTLDFPPPPA